MASTETGWTDKPAVDGVYWWRMSANDPDPDICETDLEFGTVYDIGEPQGRTIAELEGEWLGPVSPSDSEHLMELRKGTVEACLKQLREALPLGRIEIRADMTESGQIHITILNAFLDAVPYGPTLGEAMNQARVALNPSHLQKGTQ